METKENNKFKPFNLEEAIRNTEEDDYVNTTRIVWYE